MSGQSSHKRVLELEAALFAILRVTDPGDVRTQVGRERWEELNPARKIAREALGEPLMAGALEPGPPPVPIPLESQTCPGCGHYSVAHIASGCSLDECSCKRPWKTLVG